MFRKRKQKYRRKQYTYQTVVKPPFFEICYFLIRSPLLYPSELQARSGFAGFQIHDCVRNEAWEPIQETSIAALSLLTLSVFLTVVRLKS